jgi:DNA-binding MarR family transcriptional regulator
MIHPGMDDLKKYKDRLEKSLFQILANESDDDAEKRWLMEHTSNPKLKQLAPHLTILSLHTLDVISISEKEGVKGVDIAKELNVTKGAVSKSTQRLLNHGLIKKERRPDNRKEIYFYVTPLGAELAELHRQMHREKDQKAFELLCSYDLPSLELITDFMEKLARLSGEDGTR